MEIVQAVKKLNSISWKRLNFRRRPILCTTLYRNLMQASNFGGTFAQLFLRIILNDFHRRCISSSSIPWCKKSKKTKNWNQGGPALRQDPLEAILVIFGRRALIFFCLKALEKKWKMTPLLCPCAVMITLETKNVKKGHLASSNLTFLIVDRNDFRSMKEEGLTYKSCLRFFNFFLGT